MAGHRRSQVRHLGGGYVLITIGLLLVAVFVVAEFRGSSHRSAVESPLPVSSQPTNLTIPPAATSAPATRRVPDPKNKTGSDLLPQASQTIRSPKPTTASPAQTASTGGKLNLPSLHVNGIAVTPSQMLISDGVNWSGGLSATLWTGSAGLDATTGTTFLVVHGHRSWGLTRELHLADQITTANQTGQVAAWRVDSQGAAGSSQQLISLAKLPGARRLVIATFDLLGRFNYLTASPE